jgi:hypothetical protein
MANSNPMRNKIIKFSSLAGLLIVLALISTCKKLEKSMLVSTGEVNNVETNSADASGVVIDLGDGATQHGHCYGISPGLTVTGTRTELGKPSAGGFTSQLTNLTGGTKYYVKAYMSNGTETVYGKEKDFTTTAASLPVITTTSISEITQTSALSGGEISSDGGSFVTARGVCWSTSVNPAVALSTKTTDGAGTGIFASNITGLTANTTYYVRAYATNDAGTAYGEELTFTTSTATIGLATISTTAITNITSSSATSGGNITNDGGSTVTVRGVCWSTASGPTTDNSKTTDGANTGSFTSSITGLTANTKYYVRAYATNIAGTAYGSELSFTTNTTSATPPTAAVAAATSVTNTSATLNGAVNANGTVSTVTFEYGPTTLYGTSINSTPSEVTGTTTTSVSASLTGLTPGTLIHYRVKANNEGGTAYSGDLTFTTTQVPDAKTESATSVTTVSATLNATVNANSLSTTVTFEYGTTIGYGNTVTAVPNPVSGGTPTAVTYGLTGLSPNTTYHFRVKAVSTGGTVYGDDKTFVTYCTSPSATTNPPTLVHAGGSTLNGTVNGNGFSTVTTFEYGLTATYGNTIAAAQSPVTGSEDVNVNAAVSGLTSNTLYHYRVKAENCSPAPAFGSDMTLTTLATVTTGTVSAIGSTTASCGGFVETGGGENVSQRGVCWSTSPNPTPDGSGHETHDGSGTGNFTSSITGLTSNTTYYIRAYAVNNGGISYGDQRSFVTLATLSTSGITNITATTASSGGNIDLGGGASIIERGVCWSTSINPTISDAHTINGPGTGIFNSDITGLINYTNYYVRAYATNSSGTSYGNQFNFKTLCGNSITVTHTVGNVAPVTKTVTYGLTLTYVAGCWITQNLGADNQASSATDASENAAGWYWQFNRKQGYKHDGTNRTPSGTWETPIDEDNDWNPANDPCLILLGAGWRLPTWSEWNSLSSGNWYSLNDAYTYALKIHAAGILDGSGSLALRGSDAWIWSSKQGDATGGMSIRLNSTSVSPSVAGKVYGLSIRCLKD